MPSSYGFMAAYLDNTTNHHDAHSSKDQDLGDYIALPKMKSQGVHELPKPIETLVVYEGSCLLIEIPIN